MNFNDLKELLDERVHFYNRAEFIETDPIQIPHLFADKENIEIAAFLTAAISWGNRRAIVKSAKSLMHRMDNQPFDFVLNASESEINLLRTFIYRTFNGEDCIYFINSLRNIYKNYGGLQQLMESGFQNGGSIKEALSNFYSIFFGLPGERTRKHIANVERDSAAKRLNMFLRWMVRSDSNGVDFGLWKGIPASDLMLPLDLHSGNVARKLELLKRKQNNWRAVEEVTDNLRKMDPEDPVKYDFALFGMGIFEKINGGNN